MRNAIKWKILIVTCIVAFLPVIFGAVLWDRLPDTIAIHFDMNNNPDNFTSKGFAVFGLPIMMVLLQIVCCLINDINAKKYGDRKKLEYATKWIIPCMSVVLQGVTLAYALGAELDIRAWAMVISGLIMILVGNYLPKYDYIKNYDIEKSKAKKINRKIGFMSVIMGILAIVTVFLPPVFSVVWLFLLIPCALISVVYTIMEIKK